MIHTSKQLKDKVRNVSKGDNNIAKTLISNFMMERFLERVSLSEYHNNFILKGGRKKNYFVGKLEWEIVLRDVLKVINTYLIQ